MFWESLNKQTNTHTNKPFPASLSKCSIRSLAPFIIWVFPEGVFPPSGFSVPPHILKHAYWQWCFHMHGLSGTRPLRFLYACPTCEDHRWLTDSPLTFCVCGFLPLWCYIEHFCMHTLLLLFSSMILSISLSLWSLSSFQGELIIPSL